MDDINIYAGGGDTVVIEGHTQIIKMRGQKGMRGRLDLKENQVSLVKMVQMVREENKALRALRVNHCALKI
nr:MAG TPA: hypothetical protein [Caudoviricetes sp.]